MEFDNDFTVDAPVDEVYAALLDLERVTPAMPGASVLEKIDDEHYKVAIKVKLGPMTMTYRGDVTVVDKDAGAHSAVLDVKAREARGQGSANAKVTMSVEAADGGTHGRMNSQVQLSGKAAAMSRGVIDDVSKRLVTTFAENLEGILASPVAEASTAAEEGNGKPAAGAAPAPADEASAAALDVGSLAGGMAADRLKDPRVIGGLVASALVVAYLLGRRS